MFEHMKFQGDQVVPRTDAGKIAVEILDLNNDEYLQMREEFTAIAEAFDGSLKRAKASADKLRSEMATTSSVAKKLQIQAKLDAVNKIVTKREEYLAQMCGP
jgi:hypothetical protein